MKQILFSKRFLFKILVGLLIFATAVVCLRSPDIDSSFIGFDTVFHYVGGIYAAWLSASFTKDWRKILLLALAIGVAWEIVEGISTLFGPAYWPVVYSYFHGGSAIDTVSDLIADTLGALTFLVIYSRDAK